MSDQSKQNDNSEESAKPSKRWLYETHASELGSQGAALGPDWHKDLELSGTNRSQNSNICIEYSSTITNIEEFTNDCGKQQLSVTLSSGKILKCDFVVSATGVNPTNELFRGFMDKKNVKDCVKNCNETQIRTDEEIDIPETKREGVLKTTDGAQSTKIGMKFAEDGGVVIDDNFRVCGLEDVYAAGDLCTPGWTYSPFWLHMRLWTQARQMGITAARCMLTHSNYESELPLDICFDVFTHVTKFFGYKVILLGNFNATGIEKSEVEFLLRCTKEDEYIKVVLHNNRMCGAILIGETEFEETFENLILNQLDLSQLKDQLLDDTIDIEDFFD